jgi:hypothetical protein
MILSVVTGFLTLFNAGAFILLAPGRELSEYLATSVIYGTAGWLILWIVPSLFNFDSGCFQIMRAVQGFILLVAGSVILVLHPSILGVAFCCLLVAEYLFFFPFALLYEGRTALYQRIDLLRAALNLISIALTYHFANGQPKVYCLMLLFGTLLVGFGALATSRMRWCRPVLRVDLGLRGFRKVVPGFFSSNSVFLLAARVMEICVMQVLSWVGAIGAQLCFKIGVGVAQPVSSNARQRSSIQVLLVILLAYCVGLGGLYSISQLTTLPLPASVKLLDFSAMTIALPLVLLQALLLVRGLRLPNAEADHSGR